MDHARVYDDKDLLPRIAEGDRDAYRQFFDGHYTALVFFAHSFTGNITDAEDIVQEVFLKLWTKREALRAQGNLRAFCYTMVKNASLDYIRRQDTRTARQEEIAYLAEQDAQFLETAVLYEELLQLLIKEIDTLPEKYRTVITMIFIDGLSYAEIGNRLQLPEATVRKQKERGLHLLKHALFTRNQLPAWLITTHLIFLASAVTKG